MPLYAPQDDLFASNSHFLSPSMTGLRKSPSRQSISLRRSTASLRAPSSLGNTIDDDGNAPNGRHHSLAHELAVALMPEPSAGSKLLAEEFGIEYDEGAEGIDEMPSRHHEPDTDIGGHDSVIPSFADELGASASDASFRDIASEPEDLYQQEFDPVFNSPTTSKRRVQKKEPEQDAMEVLSQDLQSTEHFLGHLRSLDTDAGPSTGKSPPPSLETIASDIIRNMNDSVRYREGQVRELLEYEREFRKIASEVGGNDLLGQLDELTSIKDLSEKVQTHEMSRTELRLHEIVEEEPRSPAMAHQISASDWELDPDRHHLGDEDYMSEPTTSPVKLSFPPPPPLTGPPTPASTVPQLAHLRSFTTSLVSSLTTISEQAQVNGAATTEAGRKIRALKNKLGSWRTDWDSAERSRLRIERWEAGIVDSEGVGTTINPVSPSRSTKRIDGRRLVEEHLRAFELKLVDATLKTQTIMAR